MPKRTRSASMDPTSLSQSQKSSRSGGKKIALYKSPKKNLWSPTAIHRFIRHEYQPGWVSVPNGTAMDAGINFRLDRTPGNAELSTLFDQYRIVKAVVRIMARQGPGGATGNVTNVADLYMGRYFGVEDPDDALPPGSTNTLMQYNKVKQARWNEDMVFTVYPHVNIDSATTAVGAGDFMSVKSPWLDMANTSVQHYGLKFHSDVNTQTFNLEFDYKITYYIECKVSR